MPKDDVTIARPGWPGYVGAVGLAFYGVLLLLVDGSRPGMKETMGSLVSRIVLGSLLLLTAGGVLFWHACQRVIADNAGLRWRNLRGWHSRTWEEITDFYVRKAKLSEGPWRESGLTVEFEKGIRPLLFSAEMRGVKPLQERIVRAVGERVGNTIWEPYGVRRRDFPQMFSYEPKTLRKYLRKANLLAGAIAAVCLGVPAFWRPFDRMYVVISAAYLAFGALLLGSNYVAMTPYRVALRRTKERFLVDEAGFTFDDGKEAVLVPWANVIGYDFNSDRVSSRQSVSMKSPPTLRIRTDAGQEFTFLVSLSRRRVWMEIVRKYAVNGIEARTDSERASALGGVAARWSGGVEGQGERVFSTWTRVNLLIFVAFPVAICFCWLIAIAAPLCYGQSVSPISMIWPVIGALVFSQGAHALRRFRVQIGKEGISFHRLGASEVVPWSAVENVETEGSQITLHRREGRALRIDASNYAYGSQIAPLIEEKLNRTASGIADE